MKTTAVTPWWRHAVCYELYVRAFADGNHDGMGDLPGASTRLPDLQALGVDAVWLTPFYPSPMADSGYDISDFTAVAPELGTLDDFDRFLADAHGRGLRVLIDLVPNHTADDHPWFQEALQGGAGRERYIFRPGRGDEPPNDWQSAFGGPAWTRQGDLWYLHLHAPEQPDLNWRHPEVVAEFERVLRFWLARGVDGFRVDVAHALFKQEGLPDAGPGQHTDIHRNHLMPYYDQEELHPLYRRWRQLLDEAGGERLLVAEAAVFEPARLARYVRPDEMHQSFNFAFLEAPWDAQVLRQVIDESLEAMREVGAPVTWVLSSHDAVRPVTRFGSAARARAAALLMLALPGAVYLYQGEELGLDQVDVPDHELRDPLWERSGHTKRGRDGSRVPLPWSGGEPPFGFTSAGVQPWYSQPAHWGALSLEQQRLDPHSTWSLHRDALRLRRELFTPAGEEFAWLPDADRGLVFARGDGLVCQVNFGADPVPLRGQLLLASAAVGGGSLPSDTAAWVRQSG